MRDSLVLNVCPEECGRRVVRLGTCDGDLTAAAALWIVQDVAGIDVNMGGRMGAALLSETF